MIFHDCLETLGIGSIVFFVNYWLRVRCKEVRMIYKFLNSFNNLIFILFIPFFCGKSGLTSGGFCNLCRGVGGVL